MFPAYVDSKKVGHFLITIIQCDNLKKSLKLIINQSWIRNGNSDKSGCISSY